METRNIERLVRLPIINPETRHPSRSFVFMGKADKLEGGTLIDWKSAADPARFIRQRKIGFQPELYCMALAGAGIHIVKFVFRLVTTPRLQLCKKIDDMDPEHYEDRCFKALCEPGKLLEHPHLVTKTRIRQAEQYIWECSKRILENRKANRWLPSPNACYLYERECTYMPLCEALMDGADVQFVRDTRFTVRDDAHEELEGAAANEKDKDVLTFSSLSCLTSCEMKYFWQHEERLARQGDDNQDARWIGSAMHVGLAAYPVVGEQGALAAIEAWADANPILGENQAVKQQQEIAKARAMVRAAALKWSIEAKPKCTLEVGMKAVGINVEMVDTF